MSVDSGHYDALCTPRRAQKCLFGPGSSSSKKSFYRDSNEGRMDNESSSEDSDIGPMSPLALTDRSPSTCSSASGRQFISPFATPEKQNSFNRHWDRLTSSSGRRDSCDQSPFSALKKITWEARNSPGRKILPTSPKSLPCTPRRSRLNSSIDSTYMTELDEIIPETPQKSFVIDLQNSIIISTPRKSDDPEHRLITPLGSTSKIINIPPINRRKSIGGFDSTVSSPERKENTLKRCAHDVIGNTTKLAKTDENCTIPKARAALFQEKSDTEPKLKNFTLSTKSFYKNSEKSMHPVSVLRMTDLGQVKKRRSLPTHMGNHRRSSKRQRWSGINAGVFHGIKKPKPKNNPDSSKKRSHDTTQSPPKSKENESQVPEVKEKEYKTVVPEEEPSSEVDSNKRFFKTNKSKSQTVATVTVNHKIKLKVADGKIILNQQNPHIYRNSHKRQKVVDISFDTTDLTVDEPEFDNSIDKSKVANILKVLEDDWADDDYDTMKPLTDDNFKNVISPLKAISIPKDVTMSPASELSSMTSTMNIGDADASTVSQNIAIENNNDVCNNANKDTLTEEEPGKKYYPLFTKGYSADHIYDETSKTTRNIKSNTKWQSSAKAGGAEDQYQLDAGQKRFGATQCPECNIIYHMGDPNDENDHLNYHNSRNILKFHGWKQERVITEDPITGGRIILVEPKDSKQCWKKVSEVLNVVDRDLGLSDARLSHYRDKQIYLYVRNKAILGVLVAESIKSAHRMIPELLELDCCTAESTPAKCGINVVWTVMSHRKQGIAKKLVDTLRTNFYYGYIMSLDDIAFSIPTPSGKIFAEKYTKTRNFKVYS